MGETHGVKNGAMSRLFYFVVTTRVFGPLFKSEIRFALRRNKRGLPFAIRVPIPFAKTSRSPKWDEICGHVARKTIMDSK